MNPNPASAICLYAKGFTCAYSLSYRVSEQSEGMVRILVHYWTFGPAKSGQRSSATKMHPALGISEGSRRINQMRP